MFPLSSAEITYVQNGIEYRKTIEDNDLTTFYARIVGAIEGMVSYGHVTNLVVSDPYAKVGVESEVNND